MPTDFLEKTLEDIIYHNRFQVKSRGFTCLKYVNLMRQFRLPSGKIIDLLSYEIQGDVLRMKIIELKKDIIDEAALWQAIDYLNEMVQLTLFSFSKIKISIVLCGNAMSQNVGRLTWFTKDIEVYVYKYNFDGIKFHIMNSHEIDYKEDLITLCGVTKAAENEARFSNGLRNIQNKKMEEIFEVIQEDNKTVLPTN